MDYVFGLDIYSKEKGIERLQDITEERRKRRHVRSFLCRRNTKQRRRETSFGKTLSE